MGVGKPAVTIGSADRVLRSRQMSTLHGGPNRDLSSHGVRSQIIERCHVIKSRSGRRQLLVGREVERLREAARPVRIRMDLTDSYRRSSRAGMLRADRVPLSRSALPRGESSAARRAPHLAAPFPKPSV